VIQGLSVDLVEDQETVHLACQDLSVQVMIAAGTGAPFLLSKTIGWDRRPAVSGALNMSDCGVRGPGVG
jgi:hypothetical protein